MINMQFGFSVELACHKWWSIIRPFPVHCHSKINLKTKQLPVLFWQTWRNFDLSNRKSPSFISRLSFNVRFANTDLILLVFDKVDQFYTHFFSIPDFAVFLRGSSRSGSYNHREIYIQNSFWCTFFIVFLEILCITLV